MVAMTVLGVLTAVAALLGGLALSTDVQQLCASGAGCITTHPSRTLAYVVFGAGAVQSLTFSIIAWLCARTVNLRDGVRTGAAPRSVYFLDAIAEPIST